MMTEQAEAEAEALRHLRDAMASLILAESASERASYGDQFMGKLHETRRALMACLADLK